MLFFLISTDSLHEYVVDVKLELLNFSCKRRLKIVRVDTEDLFDQYGG